MINKTIGSGGDYADIGLAWDYLQTIHPLSDNYKFTIISDFTENTGIATGTGVLNFDSRSVEICNHNGYIIINNGKGYVFTSQTSSLANKMILDGLIIKQTISVANDVLILISPNSTAHTMSSELRNLKLFGNNSESINNQAIYLRTGIQNNVHNLQINGFGIGASLGVWAGGASTSYMENCVIYGCYQGIYLNNANTTTATKKFDFKNVVITGSVSIDWYNLFNSSPHHTFTNCADGDNSLASCGGVLLDNIPDVTSVNFISVNSTSLDFLKPTNSIDSLLGWWKGEDNLVDSVGGNSATLSVGGSGSIAYVTGVVGNAFDISGLVNKNLVFPYNSSQSLTPTNTWELEHYFKRPSGSSFSIFSIINNISPTDFIYTHYQESGSVLSIWLNSDRIIFTSPTLVFDSWYKIKIKSTAGSWQMWLDDVELTATSSIIRVPLAQQYYMTMRSIDATKYADEIKISRYNIPLLWQTGTTDISSWNTEDIEGNPRPDSDGFVSIGAYEKTSTPEPIAVSGTLYRRYDATRRLNLTKFLPSMYQESETQQFVQFFEDFYNTMYDGESGSLSVSARDISPVSGNLSLSAVTDIVYQYNHPISASVIVSADTNLIEQIQVTSIATDTPDKISILEKVNRLSELKDPDLIDIEYIQYFANNMGYNVDVYRSEVGNVAETIGDRLSASSTTSADDVNSYLRFMVSNLPNWYKIKSTDSAIKVMLYSFGLIGDLINYYTDSYLESDDGGSWIADVEGDLSTIPKSYFPTPHFAIKILVDESEDLIADIQKRESIIRAIKSIQPINTVFRSLTGYAQRDMNINISMMTRLSRYIRITD